MKCLFILHSNFKNRMNKNIWLKKNTFIECNEDLSYVNMSLFHPYYSNEKILEIPKIINLSVVDLVLESKKNIISGGSFRIVPSLIDLLINKTNFYHNRANGYGGAMYFDPLNSLNIQNCSMNNNSATSRGGTLYSIVKETILMENISSSDSSSGHEGGTFYMTAKNITLTDINCKNSKSEYSGGTFYGTVTQNINITNILVQNSTSSNHDGGSGYFTANQNIDILNFDSNNSSTSRYGGSLFVEPKENLTIKNVISKNSYSANSGGFVYTTLSKNILIQNISIENSSALYYGGGAFLQSSQNITLFNCVSKNTSSVSYYGGGIYINSPSILINQSWLEFSKSSGRGGSIYVPYLGFSSKFEVINTYFGECSTTGSGGAIYFYNGNAYTTYAKIERTTFFKCSSNDHGGAVYYVSYYLEISFIKCCFSSCFINKTGNSYLGTCLYLCDHSGGSYHKKIEQTTFQNCGESNLSSSTIYIYNGQQSLFGVNISSCRSHSYSLGYYYPTASSTFKDLNLMNSTSLNDHGIYFNGQGGAQIDLDYSNIMFNNAKLYILYHLSSGSYKFLIKYCIFFDNNCSSHLLLSTASQTIRSSYIVRSSLISSGIGFDNCITTTSFNTQTYIITHFSTYLCPTPNELGQLALQTQINCQTQHPLPTSCLMNTLDNEGSMSYISVLFNFLIIFILK